MKKIAFTLCSNNYLAQAKTLGDSINKTNPEIDFYIILVDKFSLQIDYDQFNITTLEIESIDPDLINKLQYKYDVIEINTAVKPRVFQYFFKLHPNSEIIYLDPDIKVYNPLSEVFDKLTFKSIILTPHSDYPISIDGLTHDDTWFLKYGVFNLGFIAIKNSAGAEKFLAWWLSRTLLAGKKDIKRGLFVDQKWINLVPVYFNKDYDIIFHKGYNVAYWNLFNRTVTVDNDQYFIDGEKLVFFHFSQFRPLSSKVAEGQNRILFSGFPMLVDLFSSYKQDLISNRYDFFSSIPCHYQQLFVQDQKKGIQQYVRIKKYLPDSILRFVYKCNFKLNLICNNFKLLEKLG